MKLERKRHHLTSVIKLVGYDLQIRFPEKQFTFTPIVTFLHEPKSSVNESEEQDDEVSIRQLIRDTSLQKTSSEVHASTFITSVKDSHHDNFAYDYMTAKAYYV